MARSRSDLSFFLSFFLLLCVFERFQLVTDGFVGFAAKSIWLWSLEIGSEVYWFFGSRFRSRIWSFFLFCYIVFIMIHVTESFYKQRFFVYRNVIEFRSVEVLFSGDIFFVSGLKIRVSDTHFPRNLYADFHTRFGDFTLNHKRWREIGGNVCTWHHHHVSETLSSSSRFFRYCFF